MKSPVSTFSEKEKFKQAWIEDKPIRPIRAKFTLTEKCNAKCRMCFYWRKKQKKDPPSKVIKYTLKELRKLGTEYVTFTGGEATLRKDLAELIKFSKDLGFETTLLTNGSLLNKNKINTLIAAGLDEIDISIDGLKNMHNKIRGMPMMYEKIIKNLKYISNLRKKGTKLSISISSVITPENFKVAHNVLLLRKKYNIDDFRFYPMRQYVGQKFDPQLALSAKQKKYVYESTIKKIIQTAKKVGLKDEMLENSVSCFYYTRPFIPCYLPSFQATIDIDGELFPCCHAKEWREKIELGFGNVFSKPFKQIWYGKKFYQFRKRIKQEKYPFCDGCIYTKFNKEIHQSLWGA